jgi:hypothetical protein
MGRRIAIADRPVVPLGDDAAIRDDDGADGDFSPLTAPRGFSKREAHVFFVVCHGRSWVEIPAIIMAN